MQVIIQPPTYMSKSSGFYRVIHHGMPICNDKITEQEALAAAKQMRVDVSPILAWDGDKGMWYNPGY